MNNNNKQFGTKTYVPRMAAKLIKIIVRAFNLSQDFTVQQRKNELQGMWAESDPPESPKIDSHLHSCTLQNFIRVKSFSTLSIIFFFFCCCLLVKPDPKT